MCSWLLFTCIGICIALLIRAALRAIVNHMLDDGRWDDDWRVVVRGDTTTEEDFDLPARQPHGVAPVSGIGAPTTGRGTIGHEV